MGKTEKSPFHSCPFKIMKVIYCQGETGMCGEVYSSYKGLDTCCTTDHTYIQEKTVHAHASTYNGKKRGRSEKNPTQNQTVHKA